MFYNVFRQSGGFMKYTKSQIYSLISQRVESLQKVWFEDHDLNELLEDYPTPIQLQETRKNELAIVVDTLVSELDQDIPADLIDHWKTHFSYSIYPINKLFKKSLINFFNPTMINAVGMIILGQAFMLTLLSKPDNNGSDFVKNEARNFMENVNELLDMPYKLATINVFINSICKNYQDNFMELSYSHRELNSNELSYFYVHRKRFDSTNDDVGHFAGLYNKLTDLTITTKDQNQSFLSRFPECMENTVVLRNAIFSMLFGGIDYYMGQLSSEPQALPFGRTGAVMEEIVDSYSVESEDTLLMIMPTDNLSLNDCVLRLSKHFDFMHDYLLCETIRLEVAEDLFNKKIYARSNFILQNLHERFDLKEMFIESYKLYTRDRFVEVQPIISKTSKPLWS